MSDLAAAEERFADLREHFGDVVDLVHGKMKGADKDAAMGRFAAGETRLLVATTVIEVGVDVPEATVMVIEHAERFGLAQLHQLRGRVGRGASARPASCSTARRSARPRRRASRSCARPRTASASPRRICACAAKATCSARARSGMPGFRVARIEVHGRAARGRARRRAAHARARPGARPRERGEALRHLLYLFERDEAIRLLRAG